jgi:hypothetical protein
MKKIITVAALSIVAAAPAFAQSAAPVAAPSQTPAVVSQPTTAPAIKVEAPKVDPSKLGGPVQATTAPASTTPAVTPVNQPAAKVEPAKPATPVAGQKVDDKAKTITGKVDDKKPEVKPQAKTDVKVEPGKTETKKQ